MSLYTKYRPRDWDSVIGQDTISKILRTSLELDQVGHAYIFTGSRGTGKTTSARILAKGVNCENLQNGNPCHECQNCKAFDAGNMLDVIEIDGASNNGVENVRDLIEKARFEPNQGKYKVYIIDEVHMLSTGAFNALLKTLEEPPSHVKFILATTEIDKVPETIRSRSLRFDIRKITEKDIIKRLEFVAQSEGIKTEIEALGLIAKAARGGLRDALTLLEQYTMGGELLTEYVRSSLSLLEESLIEEIINKLLTQDREGTFHILEKLRERHVQVRGFFDQILFSLRDKLFEHFSTPLFAEYESIFSCFESAYTKTKVIPDGMLLIEITFMRALTRGSRVDTPLKEAVKTPLVQKEAPKSEIPKKTEKTPQEPPKIQEVHTEEPPKHEEIAEKDTVKNTKKDFSFIVLLNALKSTKPALIADLKNARFEIEGDILHLIFSTEWNYNRVNTANIKNILVETLETLFSGKWEIRCSLGTGGPAIDDGVF